MEKLPIKIMMEIVQKVGQPPYPEAYELPSGALKTLCQLSLVNRDFHTWVEPLIYSRVVITPSKLHRFSQTIVKTERQRGKTKYSPAALGRQVKSLAFVRFDDEPTLSHIKGIAKIFYALSDTLERLLMDVFLRHVDYSIPLDNDLTVSLKAATRGLRNLREFCRTDHLPWNLDPMPWASGQNLKRLVLLSISIHYKLVDSLARSLPNVEELVVVFPALHGTQVHGSHFGRILESLPSLREVILVSAEYPLYARGFQGLLGEVMESFGSDEESEKLRFVEVGGVVPLGSTGLEDREEWFLSNLFSGKFWDIGPRLSWKEFLSSHPTPGDN